MQVCKSILSPAVFLAMLFLAPFFPALGQDCNSLINIQHQAAALSYGVGSFDKYYPQLYGPHVKNGESEDDEVLQSEPIQFTDSIEHNEYTMEYNVYAGRDSEKIFLYGNFNMYKEGSFVHFSKIVSQKYYELHFADGSNQVYEEPYYTLHSPDDIFLLLRGHINTVDLDSLGKPMPDIQKSKGDDALLQKMLRSPLLCIKRYVRPDNRLEGQTDIGEEKDFELAETLFLPKDQAIQLMETLQCLTDR